jgi:hypothetical protein
MLNYLASLVCHYSKDPRATHTTTNCTFTAYATTFATYRNCFGSHKNVLTNLYPPMKIAQLLSNKTPGVLAPTNGNVVNIYRFCVELNGFPVARTKNVQSPAQQLRNRKQSQKDIEKEFDLMGVPLTKSVDGIQTPNGSDSKEKVSINQALLIIDPCYLF